MKEAYKDYIYSINQEGSGKASSYIRALDLLNEILSKPSSISSQPTDFWSIDSPDEIERLYNFACEYQSQGGSVFLGPGLPKSYGKKGFYSAALKTYYDFLVNCSGREEKSKSSAQIQKKTLKNQSIQFACPNCQGFFETSSENMSNNCECMNCNHVFYIKDAIQEDNVSLSNDQYLELVPQAEKHKPILDFDLTHDEKVTVNKLNKILQKDIYVLDIFSFPLKTFSEIKGVGKKYVSFLNQLKTKLFFFYSPEDVPESIKQQSIKDFCESKKELDAVKYVSKIVDKNLTILDIFNINNLTLPKDKKNSKVYKILKSLNLRFFGWNSVANYRIDEIPKEIRELPIVECKLNHDAKVTVKKLSKIIEKEVTLEDVLIFPLSKFKDSPGVGGKYVDLLSNLKTQISKAIQENRFELSDAFFLKKYNDSMEHWHLNLAGKFSPNEIEKQFVKRTYPNIREIFKNTKPSNWEKKLRQEVKNEIKLNNFDKIDDPEMYSLIITLNPIDLKDNQIDRILAEDLDYFLKHLSEREFDVFTQRNGINHPLVILEEVAKKFKITRERVRQIEQDLFDKFKLNLRIHSSQINQIFATELIDEIKFERFPELSKKISSLPNLTIFFKKLTGIEFNDLPKIGDNYFDDFFAENNGPFTKDQLVEIIVQKEEIILEDANICLKKLIDNEYFECEGENIFPLRLSSKIAVAHVLLNYPNGYHWQKVVDEVHERKLTKSKLDRNRVLPSAFSDSNWVYLYGEGLYRHVGFIEINQAEIDFCLENIKKYLETEKDFSSKLKTVYSKVSLFNYCDYFTLRHFVRTKGENFGLFFEGLSNVDSVSLTPNQKVNLDTLVLRELTESEKPLTKKEIGLKIKQDNLKSLTARISDLVSIGKIVRVSSKLYTIPLIAYKKINKDEIISKGCFYLDKHQIIDLNRLTKTLNVYFVETLISIDRIPVISNEGKITGHKDIAFRMC